MARTVTAPVRRAASILGVAGIAVLAGCSSMSEDAAPLVSDEPTTETSDSGAASSAPADGAAGSGAYTAGSYEAEGSYLNPRGGVEKVLVSLTLDDAGTISAVDVTSEAVTPDSKQYQGQFISGIADEVVGKSIDELSVDKVAGSSLTSGGFNAAVDDIRTQAAG